MNLHEIWCPLMNIIMFLEVQHWLNTCESVGSCGSEMSRFGTEKVAVTEALERGFGIRKGCGYGSFGTRVRNTERFAMRMRNACSQGEFGSHSVS